MIIILPVLAVVFSAFCVWLTVRIVNRRERRAKWTLVGIGILGVPLYTGSYLLLVERETGSSGGSYWPRYGKHRALVNPAVTEQVLQKLFVPAHWIDRNLARPNDWRGFDGIRIVIPTAEDRDAP